MHPKILLKLSLTMLLLVLTGILVILPVAAQGPDVEAQLVGFGGFVWNPADTTVAEDDGTVKTELVITGAEQINGFTLAIGYDSTIVNPDSVQPGDLLPGTQGVDYFYTVQTGGGALACGGNNSFTVNVAYFDRATFVEGSGSLVEIMWRADMAASNGMSGTICLDGATSQVVDNGSVPGPAVTDTTGTINVGPASLFSIQIGLEGGKNSGDVILAAPEEIYTIVTVNGIYPCDGGAVDAMGFCTFNNATTSPPYTISVDRFGYLSADATFATGQDANSIWLLAGDLNDDDVVNILDIQLMASLLNSPVITTSTLSAAADYTGAGFAPDDVINILDLVLIAKNFGADGPSNGTLPDGGSFPF
jgi:hypothetical protein